MPPSPFSDPQDETSASLDRVSTAVHYCVDDLPGATIPSSRLQSILACLQLGRPVTQLSLTFLLQQNLQALHRFAKGELTYDAFREWAFLERSLRIEAALAARCAREAEQQACEASMQAKLKSAREQAEAVRRARESDPKYCCVKTRFASHGHNREARRKGSK